MRFGFFVTNQWTAGEDFSQKIRDAEEQVRLARQAGFDLIATGQHYLSYPYQMPTTLPFLARLSASAEGMRVAATIVLLPLHQPVDVAESVATLDAMTGGRFIFGVGQGYRDEEFLSFGTTMRDRMPRLLESLDLIKKLWTQDEVEHHGRFFSVPRVKVATRPVQRPHPPIWVAANHDAAIARAGRMGYAWLVNPHATVSMVEGQLRLFRDELKRAGKAIPELPMMRELYVAPRREDAFSLARPYLEPKYKAYADWGQDKALPGGESFAVPFEQLARDRFLTGSPEDVVGEVERYRDRLGVDTMIFRLQWPGMPQRQALEQIELMGKHVIPRFSR